MQAPQGSPSLASSCAQLTSDGLPDESLRQTDDSQGGAATGRLDTKQKSEQKKAGVKAGGLTGVAAIASATVVLPLMADGAIATAPNASNNVTASPVQNSQRTQSTAQNLSKGVLPQIPQASQATFSATSSQPTLTRQPSTRTSAQSATQAAARGSDELITQDADGNWTLTYATLPNQPTQAVVAQLAAETAQATAKACVGNDCQRLAYINRQLPTAEQRLESAQAALEKFSAEQAQSNLSSYKKVLNDRIGEISKQKNQLISDVAETRSYIGQLQLRLSTVNADLTLPERLLANDAAYQFIWADLQVIEDNLLNEYAQVDIDATELNAIYAAYRSEQQKLEQAANKALSSYLLDEDSPAPVIMYEAPAALDVMQALVVATHQEKVQQLRSETIAKLETRLRDRQQLLARDLSTYERLQRELSTAQASVDQYREEREQIKANAGAVELSKQGESTDSFASDTLVAPETLEEASFLQVRLPEGTVAKTLMGIVVAMGTVALVASQQKKAGRKKATAARKLVPSLARHNAITAEPLIPLFAGQGQSRSQSRSQSSGQSIAAQSGQKQSRQREQARDESLLQELTTLVETADPIVPALSNSEDIDLSIAVMARELDLVLNPQTGSEPTADEPTTAEQQIEDELASELAGEFAAETAAHKTPPVRLSLKEIDLFAEKAIQWVLADLSQNIVVPNKAAGKIQSDPSQELERDLESEILVPQPTNKSVDSLSQEFYDELPLPQLVMAGTKDSSDMAFWSLPTAPTVNPRFAANRDSKKDIRRDAA